MAAKVINCQLSLDQLVDIKAVAILQYQDLRNWHSAIARQFYTKNMGITGRLSC
ncbi:MAG: hypothetical protein V7K40_18375 [Nostoc sp.]|uniref:hypothetical protein n=1 Tax=Nostoc sp. TaxID=1180 RepID=UPI002FF69B8F